jgi:hypothetical protein
MINKRIYEAAQALLQATRRYFQGNLYSAEQGFRQPSYSNTLPMDYRSIISLKAFRPLIAITPSESSDTGNAVLSRNSLHENIA